MRLVIRCFYTSEISRTKRPDTLQMKLTLIHYSNDDATKKNIDRKPFASKQFFAFIILFCTITPFAFCQKIDLRASVDRGKVTYEAYCASCHMVQGEGLENIFPPLAKSDYLKDKNRLIKIVLLGARGPMKVNGVEYNGEKTGFNLTDQEVADLLNYVRNSWGNNGEAIRPSDVQPGLKAETKNFQPY